MKINKIYLFILLILIAFIIGLMLGNYLSEPETFKPVVESTVEMNETRGGGYKFINPLLECDNYKPSKINSLVKMEKEINALIQKTYREGTSTKVAYYFRNLNNGPWIGEGIYENFSPASLLKVPIMIAVLKMADKDKSVLEKKFQYKEVLDKNYVPNIKDKNKIKLGSSYTVIELIEYMIEHSDNEAKELLVALIGEQYIVKVMKEIGVDILNDDLSKDFITVKEYSSFFRMLYNATYLSRDLSEKALEILSKSDYDSGIPSGVPKNILVANKFGERGFLESDQKQLHDCGIVYYNGNPYLLCVMTKGKDFNQLSNIIAGISQIAFQNINSFN